MSAIFLIMFMILAYVVGGIPTGYMIARWRGVADIRNHGSGNMGATNVGRMLGLWCFILVFCIDACKAALIMSISSWYVLPLLYVVTVACALLLGNCYTPFLRFRGGKGVATSLGILVCLLPWWIMAIIVSLWIFLLFVTATI